MPAGSRPPAPRTAAECEDWFMAHGLPWFVAAEDRRLDRDLRWPRLLPWLASAVVLAVAAGLGQFFVRISRQLERAVQVRATYDAALGGGGGQPAGQP